MRTGRGCWPVVMVGTLVASALLVPASAQASGSGSGSGTVVVSPAPQLPAGAVLGARLASQSVALRVDLASGDPVGLSAFVDAVSTPGSASYHQYLARGQFAGRFGAKPQTIRAVRSWLTGQGLQVSVSSDHLSLGASGSAATVSGALGTELHAVRVGAKRFFANTSSVSVPTTLAGDVVSVSGLNNLVAASPQYTGVHSVARPNRPGVHASGVGTSPTSPCSDVQSVHNPTQGPFTTADLAAAYKYPGISAQSGAGQTVALYELSVGTVSDMQAYDRCFSIASHVTRTDVDGGTTDTSGSIEVLLDEEIVSSLAPQSHIVLYTGPNTTRGYLDTYSAIATADIAQVVSVSWGSCETAAGARTLRAENQLFAEMAAQGQSVLVAAGDSGAAGCMRSTGDTSVQPGDPAAQPYVTSVGGTSVIDAQCIGVQPSCEVVWNQGFGIGGAGGHSRVFPAPKYQAGLGRSWRQFPDIAAVSDILGGYLIYDATDSATDFPWLWVGGTSGAAPLEAAFVADANATGGRQAGFLNPLLYRLGGTGAYNDVTVGSNDVTGNGYLKFAAGSGFDMASGWGSPNWAAMAGHIEAGR